MKLRNPFRSSEAPGTRSNWHVNLFGLHIYWGRHRMRLRQERSHDNTQWMRKVRRMLSEYKCEGCGRDTGMFGSLYRIHPAGHPERNQLRNCRHLCKDCLNRAQADTEFQRILAEGSTVWCVDPDSPEMHEALEMQKAVEAQKKKFQLTPERFKKS